MNIKKKHINKFIKLANELDTLIKEIKEYCPEAQYYVSVETLNLMNGETHDDKHFQHSLREKI